MRCYKTKIISVLLFGIIFLVSCRKPDAADPPISTPYTLEIPFPFPTQLNIPEDNPLTVEGIELGRYLFYDSRLSGRTHADSLMSCGTCHLQQHNFEAGINHPVFEGGYVHGINGKPTQHVMLPLVNLVWNSSGYGWNGFLYPDNPLENQRNIEDFVRIAVEADNEMMGDTARVAQLFQQIAGYPALFKQAFGTEKVTFRNIEKAIAQFVRTLISTDSRFDHYLRGELQLTSAELNGYVLFTTEEGADCFHCHGGAANPLFTTHLFYNNGKDSVFTDQTDRFSVSGDPFDRGAYKVPTLRNITFSAPYMHDGRFKTLDEVIDFYSEGVLATPLTDPLMHHALSGGVRLTASEKSDLKAFILSLQDEAFITNPDFGPPSHFPDQR